MSWMNYNNYVLIGYTDGIAGSLIGGVSQYSNTASNNSVPTQIFDSIGNTSSLLKFYLLYFFLSGILIKI